YRCLGVPVLTTSATPEYVRIVVNGIEFPAGSNTSQSLQDMRRSILSHVNGLAPMARLPLSLITTAMGRIEGPIVPEGAISEPIGDVFPTFGGIIRTRPDLIVLNGTAGTEVV